MLVGIDSKSVLKLQYSPADFTRDALHLVAPPIVMIDLNSAVLSQTDKVEKEANANNGDDIPESPTACPAHAEPEWRFDTCTKHTKGSDIWSHACLFNEIRTSSALLEEMFGNSHLQQIHGMLGALPGTWKAILGSAEATSNGALDTLISDTAELTLPEEQETIASNLHRIDIGRWTMWRSLFPEQKEKVILQNLKDIPCIAASLESNFDIKDKIDIHPPHARLSEQEVADLTDLLGKILRWLPEDRISIEEVLAHPWLRKSYKALDLFFPEVCQYGAGAQWVGRE